MHYYLYQITNKVNQKIYVGVHKTGRLDDGYMGSGKVLKRAIERHGLENFEKVILETFDSAEAMYAREKEVVDEAFLAREDTYNLRRGGSGGFDWININHLNWTHESSSKGGKVIAARLQDEDALEQFRQNRRNERLLYFSKGNKNNFHDVNFQKEMSRRAALVNTGKKFPGRSSQEKNSQFGSFWITDGLTNKKARGDIPEGWRRGRITK